MSLESIVKKNRPNIQYPSPNTSIRCREAKVIKMLSMNENISNRLMRCVAPFERNSIHRAP